MKYFAFAALSVIFVFFLFQAWYLYGRSRDAARAVEKLEDELANAKRERESLEADIGYYEHPENAEKALRERFNYRAPDEKVIIIVPASSSPTSTP